MFTVLRSNWTLKAIQPLLGVLILLGSLCYATGGRAEGAPTPVLSVEKEKAAALLSGARGVLSNAKKLLPALALPPDPELSASAITRLADGAKAWKANPIGGEGGLDKKLAPLTEDAAVKVRDDLEKAITEAEKGSKPERGALDAATTDQEAKAKALLAAQEKLKQLKEKMAPQAEIDAAEKEVETAKKAADAAGKVRAEKAAELKKKQDPIDEARSLLTELKSGIEDAKKLRGKEGDLLKAVKAFTAYGNKLAAALGGQLDATQFPKLTTGKPGGVAAADALAAHLVAFGRAELLSRALVGALAPIRQSSKLDEPGSGLLVEGLEPPGYVEASEMDGTKRDDKLCANVQEQGLKTQRCVEGFRGLFDAVRAASEDEARELLKYSRTLRATLGNLREEGDEGRALPVPDENRLTLGRGLVTLINQADTAWPTLAAQLREVNELAMRAAGESVVGVRVSRDVLSAALSVLDETYTGDAEGFVNEQVRLFYFTNVPRLLQSLRRNEMVILNPDAKAVVDRAKALQTQLFTKEQEALAKDGLVADLKRRVVILRGELDAADKRLAAEQKALSDANKILSDLVSKQALADSEKAKKDADLARKKEQLTVAEKALADAMAAMMTTPQLGEDVAKAKAAVADAEQEAAKGKADADQSKALTDDQRAAVGRADERAKAAQTSRNEINRQLNNTEADALGAQPQLQRAQQDVFELRQQLTLQARIEAEAFGEASDNQPIYFAPARAGSNDPLGRVMFFAYGDSKTLFVRGNPSDVEQVLDIVAGFDRPAPQARVTLWSLQLNGRDPTQLNGSVRLINEEMRYLRANIISIQDVLQKSVNQEVNSVGLEFKMLVQGTPLDMSQRLCRYFSYPREVRERLGFQVPFPAWFSTATQVLRLSSDVRALDKLCRRMVELEAQKEKSSRDNIEAIERQQELVNEFGTAAFEEVVSSLKRVDYWVRQLGDYKCCYDSAAGGETFKTLVEKWTRSVGKLKDMELVGRQLVLRLDEQGNDISFENANENTVESNPLVSGVAEALKRLGLHGIADRIRRTPRSNKEFMDYYKHQVFPLIDSATASITDLNYALHALAKGLPNRSTKASLGEEKPYGSVPEATQEGAAKLPVSPGTAEHSLSGTAVLPAQATLGLTWRDLESVTRWTIPDPANSTTLGQTLFILSLQRRSCRLRVLREFALQLANLSKQANGAAESYSDSRDRDLADKRAKRYDRFLNDSIAVARALIVGEDPLRLLPSTASRQGKKRLPSIQMPAFPALPKAVFGALNNASSNLNDDEMTPNQLEVLMALQAKARSSCGLEVRSILRQIERTRGLTGNQVEAGGVLAWRLREQYLPLVGWLTRSLIDSPADFREVNQQQDSKACYIPPPYRYLGTRSLKMDVRRPVAADAMAWTLASLEGQRNSLTQATARVAAADEMIKRLMVIVEDDIDHYFVTPSLKALQDVIHDNPSSGTRIGDKLAGLVGGPKPRVNFGLIERTSILATNRLVARVSPNGVSDVTLKGSEDFLEQAQQLAQLAQTINNSFFAPKRSSNAAKNGLGAAGAAKLAGVASGASLGIIGGIGALLSLLDEQPEAPPGEVYALNSGNAFKLTPIFDPSGQALRFKFDYAATVNVREPNGTVNPAIPRVDRHTVNTEVQVSNLEIREISRFGVNTQLGLPEKRTGGVPIARNLPILKDIPLIGYFTRQAARGGVIQESVILGQTAIYPTVSEIVDLLVDVPQRTELGSKPPAYLRLGDRPTAREAIWKLLEQLRLRK